MTAISKKCYVCKLSFPPTREYFNYSSKNKDHCQARCRGCEKKRNDIINPKNKANGYRDWYDQERNSYRGKKHPLRWQAEVTMKELFDFQRGRCAICGCTEGKTGKRKRHHRDHNHPMQWVRGYLCSWCNHRLPSNYVDYSHFTNLDEAESFFEAKRIKAPFRNAFIEFLKHPPYLKLLNQRGFDYTWEQLYLPKWVPMSERPKR